MKFFGYFSAIVAPVVRATIWVVNGLKAIGRFVRRVLFGVVHSTGLLLRAVWQHPIVTATVGVTLAVAWMYLGWTPLLAALGVVSLLALVVRLSVRMYGWLTAEAEMPEPPAPANPLRNGKPAYRSANSTPAGVS